MRIREKRENMENLRLRLIQAIYDYGNSDSAKDFDAEDMADYLIEVIDELHTLNRAIGSKVKIRNNLIPENNYGGTVFMEEMIPYLGMSATITGYSHEEDCATAYLLDVDDSFWSWNEEMLVDEI